MRRPPRNLAASLHRRLLDGARERGEDPQFVAQRYAGERFLYRLGVSPHRDQFVLKGAMLFAIWGGSAYRPTRDLDFTGYGDPDVAKLTERIRGICAVVVPDDGVAFDTQDLRVKRIRDETEYGGARIILGARLGSAQLRLQLDVGFGNAIEPQPMDVDYPTLLDAPPPRIRAYPLEAVVADKFHAIVVLGERNSRYKDFYDLHALAKGFPFDGGQLSRAIGATFERRRTPIEAGLPAALAPRFYSDAARAQQWRAYLDRSALPGVPGDFEAVGETLEHFLSPLWRAFAGGAGSPGQWLPGGPWGAMA